jgi:hypothetical protein
VLSISSGVVAMVNRSNDERMKFCPADGLVTDDGRTYHRDHDRNCIWVDDVTGEPWKGR